MEKQINLKEFVDDGYLQEANRQFFHPLGLALCIQVDDNGKYELLCIIDDRDDPQGAYFDIANSDEERKENFRINAQNISIQRERFAKERRKIFNGGTIEQIPGKQYD